MFAVDEFIRTALAVAELDNFGALGQLLVEWKAAAEIHSDPSLASRLRKPVTGVRAPRGGRPPAARRVRN